MALLSRGGLFAGSKRVVDAVRHVVIEDFEGQTLEGRPNGGDLSEDVDALTVVVDHALDTAHLAFDAVESLLQRVLVVSVVHQRFSLRLWNRRNRNEFETTNKDEAAIAAAAMIGFRRPATASGIAATL